MESSWRRIPTETGMGTGFATLGSPYLPIPGSYLYKVMVGTELYGVIAAPPSGNLSYFILGFWPIGSTKPHFPWGAPVAPDSHL